MTRIEIRAGDICETVDLLDTPTARAVLESLPLEGSANVWGEEIYFDIPVSAQEEPDARQEVEIGTVAFWPPGHAFCIFWGPTPDPKEFFDVVKVGYEAAKRGNPDCTIITPGLAGPGQNKWGMKFLDQLLELGVAKYCDAIAIHPYRQLTPEESDLVGDLRHIVELAGKHGGRRKLWFTENCWTTQLGNGSSDRRQALMLPRCYVLALGAGVMERMLWFRFHDPGTDRFYLEHNCGLCRHDFTPRPSYLAHRTVAVLLERGQPEGEWDVGLGALARCFRTPGERVAAIWTPEGTATVSVYVGASSVRLVDIMGNEKTVPTTDGILLLTASEAMQYLRGLPDAAEARGTLLSGAAPPLVRGGKGDLTVRIRNPFAGAKRGKVTLAPGAAPGVAFSRLSAEFDVPGNSERTLALMGRISTSRVSPVGVSRMKRTVSVPRFS